MEPLRYNTSGLIASITILLGLVTLGLIKPRWTVASWGNNSSHWFIALEEGATRLAWQSGEASEGEINVTTLWKCWTTLPDQREYNLRFADGDLMIRRFCGFTRSSFDEYYIPCIRKFSFRSVTVPYWALVLPCAAPWILLLRWLLCRKWRARHGFCIACGYNLKGSPEQCPECGLHKSRPEYLARGVAPPS